MKEELEIYLNNLIEDSRVNQQIESEVEIEEEEVEYEF